MAPTSVSCRLKRGNGFADLVLTEALTAYLASDAHLRVPGDQSVIDVAQGAAAGTARKRFVWAHPRETVSGIKSNSNPTSTLDEPGTHVMRRDIDGPMSARSA